jgi:hypothetical protein
MFTSAECRAQAEQKLAQADHDDRHRKRLITAAEGWHFLASCTGQTAPPRVHSISGSNANRRADLQCSYGHSADIATLRNKLGLPPEA